MRLTLRKAEENRGDQREDASYAARVQEGTDKDGSPRYRYFKTTGEYKAYLENKGKKDDKGKKAPGDKKLGRKLDKERKETKRATKESGKKLFVKKDK